MTDPHEIIEAALADAHDIGMTDALYAKAIVRALEARFVIVDPYNVTEGMVDACGDYCLITKESLAVALRAAPKWGEKK